MPAVYRVRQFVRAAGAWVWPGTGEEALARGLLPPAAAELFRAMPRYDQQHAVNVYRTLRQQGHKDPELLAAALLHDVGKTGPREGRLRLWHRVVMVLMRAFRPGLLESLGQAEASGWRRPFYVQQYHAAIGAEMARQAGCPAGVVDLIRRHEEPAGQGEAPLEALQRADGVN